MVYARKTAWIQVAAVALDAAFTVWKWPAAEHDEMCAKKQFSAVLQADYVRRVAARLRRVAAELGY